MRIRRTFILASAGCLLFLLGCKEPKAQSRRPARVKELVPAVVCPNFSEVSVHRIILIFIDRSGSVHDDTQSRIAIIRDDTIQLVQRLPPGTVVFGRYISERSYSDVESFLADAIPAAPATVECVVTNPFDLAQKQRCQMEERQYQARLQCVEEARKRIVSTLLRLTPARAQRTDIWGGIAAASEILNTYPASVHKTIILYSDLADNVRTPLPDRLLGLEGVEVVVRTAMNGSPREMTQRMTAFGNLLLRWGATTQSIPLNVTVSSLDGLFNPQS